MLDQAVAARSTYLGLQATVIGLVMLKWVCLAGQLHSVQWVATTLLAITSPLLYLMAAATPIAVAVTVLVCIVAGGRLEQASSMSGTAAWLWDKVRAGAQTPW